MVIKNARSLWNETMTGNAAMKLYEDGVTPEASSGMAFSHSVAEAQVKVMDLLEKMPSATE